MCTNINNFHRFQIKIFLLFIIIHKKNSWNFPLKKFKINILQQHRSTVTKISTESVSIEGLWLVAGLQVTINKTNEYPVKLSDA